MSGIAAGDDPGIECGTALRVTVLMAVRNGAAHLPAQLESIAGQVGADWALWASDDGSTDGSARILEGFAATHPGRVHLREGPRAGAGANFLSLLHHPDLPPGPLAFADQDDIWRPARLSSGLAALSRIGAGGLVAAPTLVWDDRLPPDPARLPVSRKPRHAPDFGQALLGNELGGNTMTIGADLATRLRQAGPPPALPPYHDWWVTLFAAATGAPMDVGGVPQVLYRQHRSNTLGDAGSALGAVRRLRLLADGTVGGWIGANLAALDHARATGVPLTAEAMAGLDALRGPGSAARGLAVADARRGGLGGAMVALGARLGWLDGVRFACEAE